MFPQFTPRSISARLRLNPEEEEERKRGIADLNKMLQEMGARQPILENGGARPFSPRPELQENEAQSEDDMQPMLRSGSVRAFSHLPERQDEEDTHAEDDMQPMPRSGGVRAFSHLPERQDEEDTHAEDDMQPMPRSGGVRAFSHLPERRAGRDEDTAADTGSPGSFTPPVRRELDDEDSHGSSLPDEAARPAKTMPGIFAEHEPPQNTRGSFSSGSPAADPDAAPETQPLDDHDPMPGMPWDSRPPETNTSSATSPPPGSRWLQKLQPPGTRVMQAAGQQQPQPYQAAAPTQQRQGGVSAASPAPQPPSIPPKDANKTTTSPPLPKPSTTRLLTEGEKKLVRSIFGDSIKDLDKVEIRNRNFIPFFQNPGTTMTPNGNIYLAKDHRNVTDFSKAPSWLQALLIHEMTHVWQKQDGMSVKTRGLVSWLVPYDYQYEPGKDFRKYRLEQQATLIADYFLSLQGERIRPRYRGGKGWFHLRTPAEYEALIPWLKDLRQKAPKPPSPQPLP